MHDIHVLRKVRKASNVRKAAFFFAFLSCVAVLSKSVRCGAADRPDRKRWDQERLIALGVFENSFTREYRMSHKCFLALDKLLQTDLLSNEKFASIRAKGTKSPPITTTSKLGIALILLGGGRFTEATRTLRQQT
jgi:hypothetical protein